MRTYSILFGLFVGCGSRGFADPQATPESPPSGRDAGVAVQDSGLATDAQLGGEEGLIGLWKVQGRDDRGAYEGHVEFRPQGGALRFTREVRYTELAVEDGRALHWVFTADAHGTPQAVQATVRLLTKDFIEKRGAMARSDAQGPVFVQATFARKDNVWEGSYAGLSTPLRETLTERKPLGTPLFTPERSIIPSHDPPGPQEKAVLFSVFAGFHNMPAVRPYVPRPEFQAAIHGHFVDKTDFDFYQKSPNALRVVNKTIDDISLLETLMRANALRDSLATKAAKFDREIVERYFEPGLYEIPDGKDKGKNFPSPDGALWTGVYVASQALRFLTTGEPEAKTNVANSVDTLLKHQEITGKRSEFARVLRLATGTPQPPWHAGTGPFAAYEWRDGGNNDMVKGLAYGYTMAHRVLCGSMDHAALCARIRTNAKALADDVKVDNGFDSPASENDVNHHWLAAVVLTDLLEKTTYRAKAEALFAASNPLDRIANGYRYDEGIVGWSGTHLAIVSILVRWFLSDTLALNNAKARILQSFLYQFQDYDQYRLTLWNIVRAKLVQDPQSPRFADDARWRLREMPFPKVARAVDHRMQEDFCVSPYPLQPWKGGWLERDKSTSLRSYPLFEDPGDVYHWKNGFDFTTGMPEGIEFPGADFLHAYWLGRYFGVFQAAE